MKDNYKIQDLLKEDNSKYSWYQDVDNGKTPRYKMMLIYLILGIY